MADDGDNEWAQVILGAVALLVSLVALLATIMQVLQAYLASAFGYVKCGDKVMGAWAKSTRRRLRLLEFRFEVEYEVPVIFLAPPSNINGPVRGEPILYIDGSEKSREETRSLLPDEHKEEDNKLSQKRRIHTADNERASWVTLLSSLQQMEHDSQQWQKRFYDLSPGSEKPRAFGERTLAVAVQRKKKSWDTMPATMNKPYATTTICHLIELAAVLGLYWREFDRCLNKYRAEGNGFILTGSMVNELGLVFTFQKTARTLFEEDRLVPNERVKQLCFGVATTIFCDPDDEKDDNFRYPFEIPQNLAAIKLGSSRDLADTLTVMGCNQNTANYFVDEKAKTAHLFPVAFEVLGMLSQTLHGYHSAFRMLPNPTRYRWEKKSFSPWKLLEAFEVLLEQDDAISDTTQIQKIKKCLEHLSKARGKKRPLGPLNTELTVPMMDSLHAALDMADDYFRKGPREFFIFGILRSHFQVLLRHLNDDELRKKFDNLNDLSLDEKQMKLMEIYFHDIRPDVVFHTPERMPTMYAPSSGNVVMPISDYDSDPDTPHPAMDPATPTRSDSSAGRSATFRDSASTIASINLDRRQTGFSTDKDRENEHRLNDIWCTLVFRMLCWLLLHDFHKEDVQLPKSELLGSRLPVYIV